MSNAVEHPKHYNWHPAGIEARLILERMTFNTGNALKYIWRAKHKGEERQDLEKARNYIEREIELIEQGDIEFTKKSLKFDRYSIYAPFGEMLVCVNDLLSCEFDCDGQEKRKYCLRNALSELNRYLEAMQ
jgi:hypothetical protein